MYFSGKKIKWALGLHLLIPRGALKLLTEIPVTHGQQLEKAMAPHSSPLAWKIPWTEEPGGLQSMGSLRVRHNWATSLSLLTFTFDFHFWLLCIGEGNGNPLQCSCLENPRDWGAWWAAVYGVTQSQTRLKQLSSSSSSMASTNPSLWCMLGFMCPLLQDHIDTGLSS